MRLRRLVSVLAGALLTLSLAAPVVVAQADAPVFSDSSGIHVVSAQQVDARLWALSVESPALGRAVRVRVLLPTGYADSLDARYPVLYLFHGTSGGPDDWLTQGDAAATTAGRPLIVVMPDAGFDNDGGGWFTDWVNTTTKLGPSQWETFHVDQLVPWVDANLRTVATRDGRAIAGLSQGGFGAMSYAARHPDLFGVAASFSGAPEIDRDVAVIPFSTAIIEGTAVALDGVPPGSMFGPRLSNEINWRGHDPATLIPNLGSTGLYMWTASGLPGQYDTQPDLAASGVEAMTHASTLLFHQHLQQAGIPSHYDDYVFGTHSFPYWAQDLREFIGPLLDAFAHPQPTPVRITYRSVDSSWTQWGWTVVLHRAQQQAFTDLVGADAAGFTLTGSGTADVTTPAVYAPGSTHAVTIGTQHVVAVADAGGRLHLSVPLTSGLLVLGPASKRVTIGA
jgi:S-formylglutathione hydrolase FrmB